MTMIDETELTQLLQQAAAPFEPPEDGPDAVLAAASARGREGDEVRPRLRWWRAGGRRWPLAVVGAAAVIAVALAAVRVVGSDDSSKTQEATSLTDLSGNVAAGGSGGSTRRGTSGGSGTGSDSGVPLASDEEVVTEAAMVAVPEESERSAMMAPAPVPVARTRHVAGATGGTGGEPARAVTQDLGQVGGDAKVVKTGSVEVEVADGRFGPAVDRITSLVTGLGGFVAESTTREEKPAASGTITIRVPASSFEDLLREVRKLGTVQSVTVKGEDVTSQYRDLQARLTALSAARDQFLVLLRKANSVPDILSVQDRVNQVQQEIEQVQGQVKLLDDRTTFGALAVALYEPGARPPEANEPVKKRSGFAQAWDDAVDGFVGGLEAVVSGAGVGLFLLLVGGVLWLAGRALWQRRRHRIV